MKNSLKGCMVDANRYKKFCLTLGIYSYYLLFISFKDLAHSVLLTQNKSHIYMLKNWIMKLEKVHSSKQDHHPMLQDSSVINSAVVNYNQSFWAKRRNDNNVSMTSDDAVTRKNIIACQLQKIPHNYKRLFQRK